jgi:hypothetical protein
MSLAQPMYLELWEVGLARLGDDGDPLWSWLRELYAVPGPDAGVFDSYLHEAGRPAPTGPRSRADLSWWALLQMAPSLPEAPEPWTPSSILLERQGLAILRDGSRYASLECGRFGGGHGHPDRLSLTLHADGRHWLADPGTGSYVTPDLAWYRSTLAHDAPRLDGRSQAPGDARCDAFEVRDDWSWARGRYGDLARTLVAGPYLLDLVELNGVDERTLELPWHPDGRVEVATAGGWTGDRLDDPHVEQVERFTGDTTDGVILRAHADGAVLTVHLRFQGELLRASGLGRPGGAARAPFFLVRARGRAARLVSVLESSLGAPVVRRVSIEGEVVVVETVGGADRHAVVPDGWEITSAKGTVRLGGLRREAPPAKPLIDLDRPARAEGTALHVSTPPALDGSLDGFDASAAMALDYEDQYRRSEEPYGGPEEFSATLLANWDEAALYLGLDVVKAETIVRPEDAPPLRLDNDPDDIHADGVQLYLRPEVEGPVYGFLVALADQRGGIRVRPTTGSAGEAAMVTGAWQPTGTGYSLTLAVTLPDWHPRGGDALGFDLLINEARRDRLRRAGQLVWSGGGGWVYLRGDRQAAEAFGSLELA